MEKLIERLEKATGLDRVLDVDIGRACPVEGWRIEHDGSVSAFDGEGWYSMPTEVPAYTHSIDAALSLMPEGLPENSEINISVEGDRSNTCVSIDVRGEYSISHSIGEGGVSAVPAIAVCIAALSARSALTAAMQSSKEF